jgi:lipid-binding SYLF domain-containing protein
MKKTIFFSLIFLILTINLTAQIGGWDPEAVAKAEQTKKDFLEKDQSLSTFFGEAYAYVIFPSIGKGAIVVGGAHGKGIMFRNDTPHGEAKMTQVTVGFQWGGQAYSEVIFFENKESFDRFTKSKFEFAAQVSAVAATAGASADVAYEGGVAVFTMVKGGLMYEASVGGQKFKYKAFK